jgi:hypothetical protein
MAQLLMPYTETGCSAFRKLVAKSYEKQKPYSIFQL